MGPARVTLADFSMASVPVTRAVRPLVSRRPMAFDMMFLLWVEISQFLAARKRRVSRATMSSSLAGMTKSFTEEPAGKSRLRWPAKAALRPDRLEAEPVRFRADGLSDLGAVFADPAGEHDGVAAVQLKVKRTDPMADRMHVRVDGQLGARIARPCGCLDVANVVADARKPEEAALLASAGVQPRIGSGRVSSSRRARRPNQGHRHGCSGGAPTGAHAHAHRRRCRRGAR